MEVECCVKFVETERRESIMESPVATVVEDSLNVASDGKPRLRAGSGSIETSPFFPLEILNISARKVASV